MSRPFSLLSFMGLLDKKNLLTLLRVFTPDGEFVAPSELAEWRVDHFYRIYENLLPEDQKKFESKLKSVHQFSNKEGLEALACAAKEFCCEQWQEIYRSDRTLANKAFATLLTYPEIFYQAAPYLDAVTRHWSLRYDNLPKEAPAFDKDKKELLESDLEGYFSDQEGRGKVCTVERINHNGRIYFCVSADDYAESSYYHDEDRNLRTQTIRKTFSVVFAVDPKRGHSFLSVESGKKAKPELEAVFLHLLYGTRRKTQNRTGNLAMLLDPSFTFRTDPEDNVNVFVKNYHLVWPDGNRIIISVPRTISLRESYQGYLKEERLNENVRVIRAELSFVFYTPDGKVRKTATVCVGETESSCLYNIGTEFADIIEKYLMIWGIENEKSANGDYRTRRAPLFPARRA